MNKVSLLIFEDNISIHKSFLNLSDKFPNVNILNISNNPQKIISQVYSLCPDILVLDLDNFTIKSKNNVLDKLNDFSFKEIPYTIIISKDFNAISIQYRNLQSADYILSEYEPDSLSDYILSFVETIKPILCNKMIINPRHKYIFDSINDISGIITSELNKLGMTPNLKGYNYLVDAIITVMYTPHANICRLISDKYNKTESSVARAMQNAIIRSWTHTDTDKLSECYTATFSKERGAPTLKEFVAYYADKVYRRLNTGVSLDSNFLS